MLRISCASSRFLFTGLYRGARSTEHKIYLYRFGVSNQNFVRIFMSYVRATALGKSRNPTFKYAKIFTREYILNILVI